MEKSGLELLRSKFGYNKIIPQGYEEVILKALSHYPELKHLHIEFRFEKKHPVPYGTVPTFGSLLKRPGKRAYVVTLRTKAQGPMIMALFRNLPEDAQVGVIAHELGHVAQYNKMSTKDLVKMALAFPLLRKNMEKDADKKAIEHGLGEQLHRWAAYIRSIPGYQLQRPQINKYYMKPEEIMGYISKLTGYLRFEERKQ